MELNLTREGVYIAQGTKTNVLIRVIGVAPMLSITSGVLLNDLVSKGVVTALSKDDPEIQDIIAHPYDYSFCSASISDSINNESALESTECERIEYSNSEFEDMISLYKEYLTLYKEQAETRFLVEIVKLKRWSMSQSRALLKEIVKRVKFEE